MLPTAGRYVEGSAMGPGYVGGVTVWRPTRRRPRHPSRLSRRRPHDAACPRAEPRHPGRRAAPTPDPSTATTHRTHAPDPRTGPTHRTHAPDPRAEPTHQAHGAGGAPSRSCGGAAVSTG